MPPKRGRAKKSVAAEKQDESAPVETVAPSKKGAKGKGKTLVTEESLVTANPVEQSDSKVQASEPDTT